MFDEINQSKKEPSCLHFLLDWKWDPSPKLKLVEAHWCFLFAANHRGKWDKSFCFIAFDPSGMQSLCKWLPTDLHTIYNLEALSVIFDQGKLDLLHDGRIGAIMVEKTALVMISMIRWNTEEHTTCNLEAVTMVFDPGEGGEFSK